MPTVEQKHEVAAGMVNTAQVRAAVNQQASASASQAEKRQADVNATIDRLTAGVADRPGVQAQLDLLRDHQQRQLAKNDQTARKVFDRLKNAVDVLEKAHRPDGVSEDMDRSQAATRLERIRSTVSDDLRKLDDQRITTQRRETLKLLGMAADGSLSSDDDRNAMEELRKTDNKELATSRRELLQGLDRKLENERDKSFAEWDGNSAQPRVPVAGSREARGLATLSDEETAPLAAFVDRVGERAAQLLRGEGKPANAADAEKVARYRTDFDKAAQNHDMTAAGSAFHRTAKVAAEEMRGQVPAGWTMSAEASVRGGRLDLLFEQPGKAFNVDWKTTGRSALGAVKQMGDYEKTIPERQPSVAEKQLKLRQESRSWFDYIKPYAPEGQAAKPAQHRMHDVPSTNAGQAGLAKTQLRGAAAGLVADAVTSKLVDAYLKHLYDFARSHQVQRDRRSLEQYLRRLPEQVALADLIRRDYGALRDNRRDQHEALRQQASEDALRLIFEDSTPRSRVARLEKLSAATRNAADDTERLARAVDTALVKTRPAINDSMEQCRSARDAVASRPGSEMLFRSDRGTDRLIELNDTLARHEGGLRNARGELEELARLLHEQLSEQTQLAEETRRLADEERARARSQEERREMDAR